MRAFACASAASLALAAAAEAAPRRAASLNLCTDEYLLLLARPGEIASLSFLSSEPLESVLWRRARGFPRNRGTLESALAQRPQLVLTMSGRGRMTEAIAMRMGIRVIELPLPGSLAELEANLRLTAAALGQPDRAEPLIARLAALRSTAPARAADAIYLSAGGQSLVSNGLGAEWLRLAGLAQRPLRGGRADLETLLARPPRLIVRSDYRSGQASAGNRWLHHPAVRRLTTRTIVVDGRPWTCMGPTLMPQIAGLRKAVLEKLR